MANPRMDSVLLEKKTRCTVCRELLLDGQVVAVTRNPKGKIKQYLCKVHEKTSKETVG